MVDGEWVYVRLGHAGMLEQAGPAQDTQFTQLIADRIAVMFEGRLIGILDREDVTVEQVGLLMAGSVA